MVSITEILLLLLAFFSYSVEAFFAPLSEVDSASVEIIGTYSSVAMHAGRSHSRQMDIWPWKSGRKSVGVYCNVLKTDNIRLKSKREKGRENLFYGKTLYKRS